MNGSRSTIDIRVETDKELTEAEITAAFLLSRYAIKTDSKSYDKIGKTLPLDTQN